MPRMGYLALHACTVQRMCGAAVQPHEEDSRHNLGGV